MLNIYDGKIYLIINHTHTYSYHLRTETDTTDRRKMH